MEWPAGPTLDLLQQKHPVLFHQCEMIFGRRRAGQIVFALNRRLWP